MNHGDEPPKKSRPITAHHTNQQRHAMRTYLAQCGVFQCTKTLIDALITLFTTLESEASCV